MKFLFDFFPIIVFYIAYKMHDIFVATGAIIVATILQVAYTWLRHKRIEKMHVITLVLVVIFGGATIYLHDPEFIKWKVSIVNWLFAIVFLGSEFVGEHNLIKRMMQKSITIPEEIWKRLNLGWVVFFTASGFINLYIFKNFEESVWVNFKVYGLLGLTIAFVILQAFYLSRHIIEDDNEKTEKE
jgi:intracellular septation protein